MDYVGYISDVFDDLVYYDEELEDQSLHDKIQLQLQRLKNYEQCGGF